MGTSGDVSQARAGAQAQVGQEPGREDRARSKGSCGSGAPERFC
jgi:hypothetical protein